MVRRTQLTTPEYGFHLEELCVAVGLLLLTLLGWWEIGEMPLTYATLVSLLGWVAAVALSQSPRRAVAGLVRFWPLLGAVATYETVAVLHGNLLTQLLGISPWDPLMIRADGLLFGGVLPLRLEGLATVGLVPVLKLVDAIVFYTAPGAALGFAYFCKAEDSFFLELRRGLILVLFGALLLHLFVPVAGPLFYVGERFTHAIVTQPVVSRVPFNEARDRWDHFPSAHAAIAWWLVFASFRRLPPLARVVEVTLASSVTLSLVLLRAHYGVDIIAGVMLGGGAARVARIPIRKFQLGLPALPPPFSAARRRLTVLGALFVLTGAAALLAEQAFEKMLGTLLGASTPAAAIVLSVYFVGLTLGAALYGTLSRRFRNPLLVYAALEAGIAGWALLLCVSYGSLTLLFSPVFSIALGSPGKLQALRAAVACVWILPPTLLMGGSFPAIVDSLEVMRIPQPKRTMSAFYALNLLGAVVGSVTGPYVAFPKWGVDGTLLFSAILDVAACVSAVRLSRARKWRRHLPTQSRSRSAFPTALPRGAFALLPVSLASGFVLFSLEVLWTHLMSATLGNSIYSFGAMLALVLIGLFLGGAVASRSFGKEDSIPAWAVAVACVAGALLLGAQELLWPRLPARLSLAGPHISTFAAAEALRWFHAGVQILPSACVLGFVYPALFRLREFPALERARFAGYMAAANAVGCSFGALLTGFVLIPWLGSQRSLHVFALLCGTAGAVCALAFATGRRQVTLLLGAVASALFVVSLPPWNLLSLTSGEHVYLRRLAVWPDTRLTFFHEDTFGGMTTVVDNPPRVRGQAQAVRTLLTNGKFQGNDSAEMEAQLAFALIPFLHAHAFEQACVIGLGTGQSASVPALLGFSHLDIAELSPGIVLASRYFSRINRSVLDRPGVVLWLEDGRNVLLLHRELRCDLVSMEISSVWFAGSTNLYSREFYELAKARLGTEGVFQQWIQVHHIGMPELGSVIATVRAVFPHVSFWVFGGQGIVLASVSPLKLSHDAAKRFISSAPQFGLDRAGALHLLDRVLGARILDESDVTAFVGRHAFNLNTDRNRHLEYATARYNVSRANHSLSNVRALTEERHSAPLTMPTDWLSD